MKEKMLYVLLNNEGKKSFMCYWIMKEKLFYVLLNIEG